MKCPYCSKIINDNAQFCGHCGKKITGQIGEENEPAVSTDASQHKKETIQEGARQGQGKKRGKGVIVAALIALAAVGAIGACLFFGPLDLNIFNSSKLTDRGVEQAPAAKADIENDDTVTEQSDSEPSESDAENEEGEQAPDDANEDSEESSISESSSAETSWDQGDDALDEAYGELYDTPHMFIKNIDDQLRLRSQPQNDSELVGQISDDSILWYYGESREGPGSDGQMHTWYFVYTDGSPGGWVRSDLVKEIEIDDVPAASNALIADVSATSALNEVQYNVTHSPDRVLDGDLATAWSEGVDGQGIGEEITITFSKICRVSEINIWAGYHKSNDAYQMNSRPSDLTITFSNGQTETVHLSDSMAKQTISLDEAVVTKWIAITIDGVYQGSNYSDTLISELSVS